MLTKHETDFISYWEKNRLVKKKSITPDLCGAAIGSYIGGCHFCQPAFRMVWKGTDGHVQGKRFLNCYPAGSSIVDSGVYCYFFCPPPLGYE